MADIVKEYTYIDRNGLERKLKITIKDGIDISEHTNEVVRVFSEHAQGLLRIRTYVHEWIYNELRIPSTWKLCYTTLAGYWIERTKSRRGNIIIE